MKTLTINEKDYTRAKNILKANGIITKSEPAEAIPLLRKSNAKPGETPATFGGIWDSDKRTMASIRAKAWPKRR